MAHTWYYTPSCPPRILCRSSQSHLTMPHGPFQSHLVLQPSPSWTHPHGLGDMAAFWDHVVIPWWSCPICTSLAGHLAGGAGLRGSQPSFLSIYFYLLHANTFFFLMFCSAHMWPVLNSWLGGWLYAPLCPVHISVSFTPMWTDTLATDAFPDSGPDSLLVPVTLWFYLL